MADIIITNDTSDGITLTNDDMIVSEGGIATSTFVENYCTLYVFEGGTANDTTIGAGGYLVITDGGSASAVLTQGQDGVVEVHEGGELYDATINAGGWLSVLPGGKAVDVLENGGFVDVMAGADVTFLSNTIPELVVSAGQMTTIHSATTVDFTLVTGSGYNGGMLFVCPDATISDIVVNSNGSIENDGVLKDLTALEGGYVNIRSGQMQGATLSSGGHAVVYHGGSGMDVSVLDEGRYLLYGGQASGTTVSSGGIFTVQNTINSSTSAVQSGIASSSLILSGGEIHIASCGAADDTVIESGGSLSIFSGGTATNLTVEDGAILSLEVGPDTYVQGTSGGQAFILADALLSDFFIDSGGSVKVAGSGRTSKSTVGSGGSLSILDGGSADDITVNNEGHLSVLRGGKAKTLDIGHGAFFAFYVSPDTIVGGTSGDTEFETSDGLLSGYVIESGRIDVIDGRVKDITVNSGGELHLSGGGIADDATVNSGGYLLISSGGRITGNMVFDAGAVVSACSGAILDFDIVGTSPDGTALVNNLSVVSGTPTFTLTVDGTQENGNYILAEGADGFDASITIVNALGDELGTLSVGGTVTINDTSYTLTLSDSVLSVSVANGMSYPIISSGVVIGSGSQTVSSGIIYETTIVSSGGWLYVSHGGIVNNPTVYSEAGIDVCSGGTINCAVISSGSLTVSSGGTANNTTIDAGGSMFISSGGFAGDTICSSGSVMVLDGGTADDIAVGSRGKLHISSGGRITGQMEFESGAVVSAHHGAIVDFDLTGTTAGGPALLNDLSMIRGTPTYTLTVDGLQENGNYALAEGAAGFHETVTVVNPAGETFGTLSVGQMLSTANAEYTLRLFNGVLSVSVSSKSEASVVSSGLVLLEEGRIVSSGEIYEDTTVFTGGWLYVSSGGVIDNLLIDFQGDCVVSGGGKMTGNLFLGDGAFVSVESGAVLEFDLTAMPPGGPALVNDLSRIEGTPRYTLVVNMDQGNGVYFLARGAESFNETITVENKIGDELGTLSVGGTLSLSGIDFSLVLSDGTLCVSVSGNSEVPVTYSGLVFENEDRTVYSGEVYETVRITSGGRVYVSSGGVVSDTVVISGGWIQIYSYGLVTSTTISSGGGIDIFSEGILNDAVVSFGILTISSGGRANDTTVNNGGVLHVSSAGLANNTTVNSSGGIYVSAGGTANSTTVNSGGSMSVSSGGIATVIVENGGYVDIAEGANAAFAANTFSDLTLSNASATVHSGTTALNTTIRNGHLYIHDGGTADSTTINSRGSLTVFDGGTANSTMVNSRGSLFLSGGGTAKDTVVDSYGNLTVSDGGIASHTTVNWSGFVNVSSGGTADDTVVNAFGSLYVSGGGSANSTTVNASGILFVSSGGTATGIRENGGYVSVGAGATAVFVENTFSGLELSWSNTVSATVHSGTTANSTTVNSRGRFDIFSGGIADSTTVNSGGNLNVSSGGTAYNVTVNRGGTVNVRNGTATIVFNPLGGTVNSINGASVTYLERDANVYYGHGDSGVIGSADAISGLVIDSGYSAFVYQDGLLENPTVNQGGWLCVSGGGSATDVVWTPCDGTLQIDDDARVSFASRIVGVYYGGSGVLESSAMVMDDMEILSGKEMYVMAEGLANSTTVSSGGSMYVSGEGAANGAVVSSGAFLRVASGGTASLIEASSGAILDFSVAPDTIIGGTYDNAAFEIGDGVANLYAINSGCILRVSSGGVASATFVYAGGDLHVSSGGAASRTQVNGGTVRIKSGGIVDSTSVNSGSIHVSSGGEAVATTVNVGGLHVSGGGSANGTTINAGGNLHISSGGIVDGTTINAGGNLHISSGGMADGTTVNSGGRLHVSSGGTTMNIVASTGASLILVVASDTCIQGTYDGTAFEMKDAFVSGYEIHSGCSLAVLDGGTANDTVVNARSVLHVSGGGVANNTTINNGLLGSMCVFSGGTANVTGVSSNATFFVSGGGTANDTTVFRGGRMSATSAIVSDVTIHSGGSLSMSSGKLTGRIFVESGANVAMTGTVLDFDVSRMAPGMGARVNDLSMFQTGGAITLTVSDAQWNGMYILAEGADGFDNPITLKDLSGETLGLMTLGESFTVNGVQYALSLTDDTLSVTVTGGNDLPAIPVYADVADPTNQSVTVTAVFGDVSVTQEYSFDNETWLVYTDPVSVEENGTVYFIGRSQDGTVVEAAGYEVTNIDRTPPEAPDAIADITDPTNADVFVSASFSDDTALGEYSLNGETWSVYTEAVKLERNGTVYFRAADAVGNVSEVTSYEVTNIDRTPPEAPVATADVTTPTNRAVTVSATFSDDTALGEYSLNGETWNDYVGAVSLEENGTVYFRAADAVGNVSEVTPFEVANIDTTPPERPTFTVDVTTPTNTNVTVTAEFSADSVRKEYSLDGTTWLNYTGAITFSENGAVSFRGIDEAGNISEPAAWTVDNIDKVKPVLTLTGDNQTPLQAATLSASADDGSDISYSTDNVNWMPYAGQLAVTANATYYFKATDAAGNTGTADITFTNVDTTPPEITLTGDRETPLQVTTLSASADDGSRLFYRIGNSEDWKEYTGTLEVRTNASYRFRATDAAGNTGTADIVFTNIDTTAPTVSDVKADVTAPTNQDVVVTANFADNVAVASSLYRIGETGEWTAYSDGVTVTENATVYFKAVDTAGNESEIVSCTVGNIDKVSPVLTLIGDDRTPARQTMLTALADDGSEIYYSTDNANWAKYEEPFMVSENGTYYFRATDAAGNIGTADITFSNIDGDAPARPIISVDNAIATNQPVTVTAEFSADSIVRQYSLDGQIWLDYTEPLVFEENGIAIFLSVDAAGNSSYAACAVTNIDTVPPAPPVAYADVSKTTNGDVNVTAVFGEDSVRKEYSMDGENWTDYSSAILFTDNGTVFFRGADAVGNVSEVTSFEVANIDKTAPEAPTASGDVTSPTNGEVLVSAVFDDDSAVREYSLNGQVWTAYTEDIRFTENGSVSFRGIDEAGNVSEITVCTVGNIDRTAPVITLAGDNGTPLQAGTLSASADDGSKLFYRIGDSEDWTEYTGEITVSANATYRFKATDAAGNTGTAEIAFANIDTAAPTAPTGLDAIVSGQKVALLWTASTDDLSGVKEYIVTYALDGQTFTAVTSGTGHVLDSADVGTWSWSVRAVDFTGNESAVAAGEAFTVSVFKPYTVEYSSDNFEHTFRFTVSTPALNTFRMPGGTYRMRVRQEGDSEWMTGDTIVAEGIDDTPQVVRSDADGNADVFFANAVGTWESGYVAQHVGSVNDWAGTGECVSLYGRNRLADIFEGSADANILLMSDDDNGDTLFVDDIYTASPGNIAEQQARVAQIDEIRAGAGNDIVDMTSQQFEYIGDGLTIRGGEGNDTIWANKGNNWLFGDAGNDRIVGASGNDVIAGGIGNDRMHGGGGDDVFTFCDNWGVDNVEQLESGSVTLWFASGSETNWNAETLTYTDGDNSVAVKGVTLDKITLKFGDDGSARFAVLTGAGAFFDATTERIFEESGKGILASL